MGTGDVHYLRREDYEHHTALLCVQTKSTIAAPKLTFDTNEFYLRDNKEMTESFAQWPEALANTLEIAERCSVHLELGKQLIPSFPTPGGAPEREYLRARVEEGMRTRYGDPPSAQALERMEMELGVIDRMGFNAYFLIVWDFVKYAKENGIAVGPGRGSAAGSIVAYCLQITDVDPLRYELLFERFLNPERVSMPDIDIDFSVRGRERVMRYVTEKYGRESVAQIVTFGKMLPRAATRDAARVLGFDYATGDRLAKLIPDPIMGRSPSFEECLKPGEPLRKAFDEEPDARRVLETARGLEGIVRNSSIHAAAVVIADRPLTDIVPLQLADAGAGENGERSFRTVTQFSMKPIEEIGLLKMDFLGLRNLDVIEDALDIIERSTGERPDWTKVPLDDQKTYEMLARGDSIGVFQFESEGMREALKKVRPDEFNDLVALNALYRPGAMDQIPVYAKGKHNPQSISYPDERLRAILESSNGVILYQEQAMQISKELAGFSGAKADDLRKAIGKKNRAAMAALKPEFVEGCRASGTKPDVIEFLWQSNEKSADYSFNKSHAACYGLIAYRTAWLKANYTPEYMAALISSVMSTKDKVPFFVARCEELGIEILPPDVNLSDHEFTVVEGNIRFGLDAVKGVGYQAVEAIKRAREEAPPRPSPTGSTPVHLAVGLLRARGQPRRQQEGDRGADQVRGVRLHRSLPQGHARRARAGSIRWAEGPAGRPDRPGLDLRPGRRGRRTGRWCARRQPARCARAASARPMHPRSRRGVRPGGAAGRGEGGDRAVRLRPPAQAGARGTARPRRLPAREARRAARQGVGHRRRHRDRVQAHPHPQRRPHDVRHARRSRGLRGDARVRQGARRARGGARRRSGGAGARARRSQGSRQDLPGGAVGGDASPRASRRWRTRARHRCARRQPARPVCLRIDAAKLPASAIDELKHVIGNFPGPAEVCSRWTPPLALAACASERPTGWSPRPRCGRSWSRSWAASGVVGRLAALARRAASAAGPRPGRSFTTARHAPARLRRAAKPRLRSAIASATSSAVGPPSPGGLQDAGQILEGRGGEEGRAAALAQLPLPDVGVAVAARAEGALRVVEVQRAQPLQADLRGDLLQQRVHARGRADVIAGGEQVAGVQAHPQPLPAAGGVDQRSQLLHRAPQGAAAARGVLQVQRAALALGERLADRGARARDRLADVTGLRRAGVQHHAAGPDRSSHAQRVDQRGAAFWRGCRGPRWRS